MMAGRVFVTQKPLHASDKTQENFEKKKEEKEREKRFIIMNWNWTVPNMMLFPVSIPFNLRKLNGNI